MTLFSCDGLAMDTCLRYVWKDYSLYIEFTVAAVFLFMFWRHRRSKDANEPLSTLDEFDKSGWIHVNELEKDQEGSSFLVFDRANGDVENREIGQPFAFVLEDNTLERHHLNARGAYPCVNPTALFKGYTPDEKQLTRIVALSEQHIRQLRTGGYDLNKASHHIRMFILIFAMSCCIGIGIAAATVHHGP